MTNKSLFSPFSINNHELKNRFVMAPMTRNFSPEGIPSEYAPEYYAKRARGGVALILTEGVEVSHPSQAVIRCAKSNFKRVKKNVGSSC